MNIQCISYIFEPCPVGIWRHYKVLTFLDWHLDIQHWAFYWESPAPLCTGDGNSKVFNSSCCPSSCLDQSWSFSISYLHWGKSKMLVQFSGTVGVSNIMLWNVRFSPLFFITTSCCSCFIFGMFDVWILAKISVVLAEVYLAFCTPSLTNVVIRTLKYVTIISFSSLSSCYFLSIAS